MNEIKTEQVSTSLCPASCVNATLLAFAGDRWIDISRPPGPQQQTRRTPLLRSIVGTDRQVDRQTDAYGRAPPYLSEHCTPVFSFPSSVSARLASSPTEWRSAFHEPSPTCRTVFPAHQHSRPSGVLSCWPDGLELTPGLRTHSLTHYPDSANNVIDKCTVLSVSDFADKELHGQWTIRCNCFCVVNFCFSVIGLFKNLYSPRNDSNTKNITQYKHKYKTKRKQQTSLS